MSGKMPRLMRCAFKVMRAFAPLAKDLLEGACGDQLGCDEIPEHISRAHRGQLKHIAH